MEIYRLQKEIHEYSKKCGWYDEKVKKTFLECCALFHSEISEAVEEYRKYGLDDEMIIYYKDKKPEGIGAELADVIIRVLDTAEWLGLNMEGIIRAKMDYNKTRPRLHGGKKA